MADPEIPPSSRSRISGYLATLDGWRTIAILSVIFCHDRIHSVGPFSTRWLYLHGQLGVDLFFAISGLLICTRLLVEEEASGTISLRNFYLRRAFRILPAAILFLLTLFLLKFIVHLPVGVPEILASLFFLRNYTFVFTHFQSLFPGYTAHFWSLAVEEHFYFLLPGLLVFTPRRWRVPALLTLAVAVGLHRITPRSWLSMHTDMRLDALLVPAALAILLRSTAFRDRLIRWLFLWPLLLPLLLVPVTFNLIPRTTGVLIAWLMPFLVLGTMLRPHSWFGRLLEAAPLRYIGRLSYSLYLWQQLFFIAHYDRDAGRLGLLQQWPLALVMTFACALLSYYCVERPFIRLGHRLAPNVAANRIRR